MLHNVFILSKKNTAYYERYFFWVIFMVSMVVTNKTLLLPVLYQVSYINSTVASSSIVLNNANASQLVNRTHPADAWRLIRDGSGEP